MLIKLKGFETPKPKVVKASTPQPKRQTRRLVDDTQNVKAKMEELFGATSWKVVTTQMQLEEFLKEKTDLGIDTETTGLNVFDNKLTGFSLGDGKECIYIPIAHKVGANYRDDLANIEQLLSDKRLYGFNLKFDLKFLKKHLGFNLQGVWCGFLAARTMNSAEPRNELKTLYQKYVDPTDEDYSFRKLFGMPFDMYDPEIVGGYAAVDANKHLLLAKHQQSVMQDSEKRLLLQLELPLTHMLIDVELTGIKLDVEWTNQLVHLLEKDLEELKNVFEEEYDGINPASSKQVAEYVYDKLKFPQIYGRSTGAGALAVINHPIATKVIEYRKTQKLLSTYAKKMPEIANDGIINCTFNQYGADTGRFSSADPNLQNIPRDVRFRKMFTSREGHKLVSCDYSQQEVYILAALANDETMIEAFRKGYDFYGYMASIVFNVPYEQCQKGKEREDLRDEMKAIVLALNYDKGIRSLATDLGKTIDETKEIYEKFFTMCPKVRTFRNERLEFAKKYGYVETILGRKRHFIALHKKHDFESDNKPVEQTLNQLRDKYTIDQLLADARTKGILVQDFRKIRFAEVRQVVNSIVQGSAADMTKLAMLAASRDPKLKELGCKILLQVHDEIVAEFPNETAEEGAEYLANLMIDVGTDLINVPVKCDYKVMEHWS